MFIMLPKVTKIQIDRFAQLRQKSFQSCALL